TEAWAGIAGQLLGWMLVAAAPFARGRVAHRRAALWNLLAMLAVSLVVLWGLSRSLGLGLPNITPHVRDTGVPMLLTSSLAMQALLNLFAVIGFANRFRTRGE